MGFWPDPGRKHMYVTQPHSGLQAPGALLLSETMLSASQKELQRQDLCLFGACSILLLSPSPPPPVTLANVLKYFFLLVPSRNVFHKKRVLYRMTDGGTCRGTLWSHKTESEREKWKGSRNKCAGSGTLAQNAAKTRGLVHLLFAGEGGGKREDSAWDVGGKTTEHGLRAKV